jgi:hypothetical protein
MKISFRALVDSSCWSIWPQIGAVSLPAAYYSSYSSLTLSCNCFVIFLD